MPLRRLQRPPSSSSSSSSFNCFCQLVSRNAAGCWPIFADQTISLKTALPQLPHSLSLSPWHSFSLPLKRICMQIRWISLDVSVCVCVQSKVSNNVSGRMCLAIEIYLHYYSVLTMRLGSSISPLFAPLTVLQSPRTVFDLRSRCLDLWVARQLVKPCLRQHGQACTQRQHLSRWLLSRSSSLCALLFRLLCCAVFFWSLVFSHLPELLSSFSYQDSIRAA